MGSPSLKNNPDTIRGEKKELSAQTGIRLVQLTCGAQTVIQQLGGQEACGAGRVRGGSGCRTAACRACRGDAGRVEHPEGVLPLPAELISASWTQAEEVREEGHVAALTILLLPQTTL